MKGIVVATDLSAGSDRAVQRSVLLAAQTRAKLVCLHVIGDAQSGAGPRQQEAEATIRAQLGRFPQGQNTAAVRVVAGTHIDAILKTATEEAADLIVIGPHRSVTGVDLFRGSTGERVLRSGSRPVLLVKQQVKDLYRRIVIAIDFSAPSRAALDFAIAAFPDAEMSLLHAYHVPPRPGVGMSDRLDTQFGEFLTDLGDRFPAARRLAEEGPPAPTLLKAIARLAPDLVVVGTHGRTGSGPMQIGTVAERILSESATDVLAVRA